ncbi:MAG TPA: hypothetical protein DEP72_05895 [Clostridiales bacterium]|nr:MAG: hypothetical protein A2Y18_06370 [Clostridiales bacterium GWD2_32_19]HCC07674.1 hypothetical protein [Clostridiales bacterium]
MVNNEYSNRKIKRVKKGKLFFSITIVLLFLVFFAILGGVGGYIVYVINTSPNIDSIMVAPKGYTTILYDNNKGNEVYRLHGDQNRIYAGLDKIPVYLQNAFISIEDERFYDHHGIDYKGIVRAVWTNITKVSLSEGASTITQQLIRNNMLTLDKKFDRKIREQYLALTLEKELEKDVILELYLNTINLGSSNCYGVQAAANRYFNKDVSALSLSESTVIAGITKNPTYYDPTRNPENTKKRQHIILKKMLDLKKISKEEYDKALADDVFSRIANYAQVNKQKNAYTSYFVDEVIREVKKDLVAEKGLNENQAINLIYGGGLSIYTTVDQNMQTILEEEYVNEKNFPKSGTKYELVYALSTKNKSTKKVSHYEKRVIIKSTSVVDKTIEDFKSELMKDDDEIVKDSHYLVPQPQSAMVITEQSTGHVKAIVGGRGEKNMSRDLDRATQSLRQPGSTFKVLASFAPALDSGKYTLASIVDDIPYHLGQAYQYKEYKNWYSNQDFAYRGLSTIREGIRDSMNIVAVKTLMDIGITKSFNYLKVFGFTTLVDKEIINKKTYTDKSPGVALGGLTKGVSLLELTTGYATIANGGTYIEPIFYTKVLDHNGNVLLEEHQVKRKVLKPSTCYLLTSAMKDVMTSGTGTAANFRSNNIPVAGKTGTTSDNKDILFVGYTPYYTAGIWAGYDKPETLPSGATSFHKTLWSKVMGRIHAKLRTKDFKQPSNIVTASICTESGKLAVSGLCTHDPRGSTVRNEYFVQGTQPTTKCNVHQKVLINSSNGKLATSDTPSELSVEKVFIKRPATSTYSASARGRIKDSKYEIPKLVSDIPITPDTVEQTNTQTKPVSTAPEDTTDSDLDTIPHETETTAAEE